MWGILSLILITREISKSASSGLAIKIKPLASHMSREAPGWVEGVAVERFFDAPSTSCCWRPSDSGPSSIWQFLHF